MTTYTFDTGEAKHKCCKIYGIKSFYIPRSNPDGFDINIRCLDTQPKKINFEKFDGKNRELHEYELSCLSEKI